jgi:hypothetical protein
MDQDPGKMIALILEVLEITCTYMLSKDRRGLAFSIISIIIYPLISTGWSSFFGGSVASAASVLVMTQATSKGVNCDKAKTN